MNRPFDKKRPRGHTPPGRPSPTWTKREDDTTIRLFGIHAVEAALGNGKRIINKLMMTENAEHKLANLIAKRGVNPERVTPRDLDRILGPGHGAPGRHA